MASKSRIIGAHSLRKTLLELGRASTLTAPVGRASRFALQPILKAAKANTPHAKVKKALVIKKDAASPKDRPVHAVGGDPKNPDYRLLHLLEFDTRAHPVNHPGTTAQPFLTPAFEAHADEALKRFGESIGPEIEKQAARLARKNGRK